MRPVSCVRRNFSLRMRSHTVHFINTAKIQDCPEFDLGTADIDEMRVINGY
jgi:hypothetical protein